MRAVLLVRFLTIATITFSIGFCDGNLGVPCKESEKQALLMFKQDLHDPANRLSSWVGEGDCCNWIGVVCDNVTGYIRELHLNNSNSFLEYNASLGGKINPSLFNLKHLNYLDLSNNDFEGIQIPRLFGSLKSLRYLNLSNAEFSGTIPHQLGNLSSLRDLRLDSNNLEVENLQWISGLSHLEHLNMIYVNLSKASDHWLQVTNMLPSLVELHMSYCGLDHIPPLPIINFTSLAVLDLSNNKFDSLMPSWFFSLRNLVSLDLTKCGFHGPIPSSPQKNTSLKEIDFPVLNLCELIHLDLTGNNFSGNVSEIFESLSICSLGPRIKSLSLGANNLSGHLTEQVGNLKNLNHLDLYGNSISGPIPFSLGNLKNLNHLDLSVNSISGLIPASLGNLSCLENLYISNNQLNGALPKTIGQLEMLSYLDISENSLEGVVSEVHFTNLTRLKYLYAKGNSLTLKTSGDWLPPFQLWELILDNWHLGHEFPTWLPRQTELNALSLSNTGISDTFPTWLWNLSSPLRYLDLSHNQLYGEIKNKVVGNVLGSLIDLSSNRFNGSLPLVSSTVRALNLANSTFSGSVFHFFCDQMDVPKDLTTILYLGNNLLTGKIPDCWMNWPYLNVVNLENNNFIGNIPSSMGYLAYLESLHLRNNQLSGELPSSLENCTQLSVLLLGGNELVGKLPTWIGKSLSNLMVLDFRSNKLQGDIPYELCHLRDLQILDLAYNNLSGIIPKCFHNFSAMATLSKFNRPIFPFIDNSYGEVYMESAILVTKGRQVEYSKTLSLVTSIDLSNNIIFGGIPEELTSLIGLQTLNLSNNLLAGRLPSNISNMTSLESLDLSMNELFGEIPPSLASLTFLSHLNLSYNNLSGHIPESTQLQSFDQFSFIGNKLCGLPLNHNCSANRVIPPTIGQHKEYNLLEDKWFYLSLGLGFAFGFWSILGSLLVNMPWSVALSRFLNSIVCKLYAVIVDIFS